MLSKAAHGRNYNSSVKLVFLLRFMQICWVLGTRGQTPATRQLLLHHDVAEELNHQVLNFLRIYIVHMICCCDT